MAFSQAQTEQLLRPVNPRRVQRNDKGMSHLAAYDVSAHLTRIFGFGGSRQEILPLDLVAEDAIKNPKRDRLRRYLPPPPPPARAAGRRVDGRGPPRPASER